MPERKFPRVTRFVAEHPWAILPERLDAILDVLQLHLDGRSPSAEEVAARVPTLPDAPAARTVETVAVIPVHGVIAHRMNLMTAMSGGTSTEALAQALRVARADDAVKSIVLDIDSPGGSVFGVQELADEVFSARGPKPIIALANATAASAAYWIGSQADQFLVIPSGMAGSVGVIAVHQDRSKQAEMLGVKHTFITAGKFKGDGEGNDLVALSDPARESMQRKVDQYYDAFVRAVARGRGAPAADVRGGMGEGRMLTARDAVAAGMADGVATLDQVLGSLLAGRKRIAGTRAEESGAVPVAWQDEAAAFRAQLHALAGEENIDATATDRVGSTVEP